MADLRASRLDIDIHTTYIYIHILYIYMNMGMYMYVYIHTRICIHIILLFFTCLTSVDETLISWDHPQGAKQRKKKSHDCAVFRSSARRPPSVRPLSAICPAAIRRPSARRPSARPLVRQPVRPSARYCRRGRGRGPTAFFVST